MTRAISGRFPRLAFLAWPFQFWSSRSSATQLAVLIAASATLGVVGWSGNPLTLPLTMAFPAVWRLAGSRVGAALIASAYFMGASRGLPEGVSIFFDSDLLMGLALWIVASLAFVFVHTACWTKRKSWLPCRYLLANALMAVPPLGIVGWANPITAAGIIFPGWRWWGLAVTIVLLMAMTTRFRWFAVLATTALGTCAANTWTEYPSPVGWKGVDTRFVSGREQYADYDQQVATMAVVRSAVSDGAKVVVLPESAFGIWTATSEALWRRWLKDLDVTVVGGAVILTETEYDNLVVSVTADSSAVLYRQRMPVPVSMWQPWKLGGANANFFGNAVVEFGDQKLAVLVCYEQLLVWPVLHSVLNNPDVLIGPGNGWWTGSTNILPIQKAATIAWARLFGLPLVMAFNAPA